MTHNVQNVEGYHAGDALRITVTVEDSAGNVVDISGANEIEYYIKENETDLDSEALVSKTLTGTGVTITDGPNGEYQVDIATGDTDDMAGPKHHRSRIEDGNGNRSTTFTGTINIST